MGADEQFDVVVVGARCAGSPLATLLAREGVRVAVVEKATFPADTLSTHIIEANGLAFLDRLGVMDRVRATGVDMPAAAHVRLEDFELTAPIPLRPGETAAYVSVRRMLLDPILADAAATAGADIRMASRVTDLVHDRGRVAGVRVASAGEEQTLRARLVVGADGRNSTIARLAGSRKYNVTPSERFGYWAFYEGGDTSRHPELIFFRWDGQFVIAGPADSGLYQVIVLPEMTELPRFRQDLDGAFTEYWQRCAPVAEVLENASRVGKILGMIRWEGFFREPSGPGWVLAGDAGLFKDPAPGQGISDAFWQCEALAPAIVRGLNGSDHALDRALAEWGRWRDRDAAEHYWLATDLGKAGKSPPQLGEIGERLFEAGRFDPFMDIFHHHLPPSRVITPPRLIASTGRLLVRGDCDRRALLRETAALIGEDMRRKRVMRKPLFATDGLTSDAGETEVAEPVAV